MAQNDQKPEWAPKVSQSLVRRLYVTDAQGIVDDELIDEVGWALWSRCDSILIVTAAHYGQVRCPSCDAVIERHDPWTANEQLHCEKCDWHLPWATYHQTYRGKQLFGANAVEAFRSFQQAFPIAQMPNAKMLLIDRLIHAFHVGLTDIGRPAAANLITGNLVEVIHFLDGLARGDTSASGLSDSRAQWRRTLAAASWSEPFLPGVRKTD